VPGPRTAGAAKRIAVYQAARALLIVETADGSF
jgi:hypothetical protein